jgi:ATP-dependent helicase/nuclease subunit A
MSALQFTPEQREAVADRAGSALLAANAGSGKTAVMAERFVEAVLRDDVAVGAILALTFTEKAAGELRERIRRRFSELGEDEHAREVDGAWVGTIHGFCAGVLRAQPLAAGLDPRFDVLDEPAAQRLANGAYDRAFEAWAAAPGSAAVDLAAGYGPGLQELVLRTHAVLRSRGQTRPVLSLPARRQDPVALRAALVNARRAAAGCLDAGAGNGKRVSSALAALEAAGALLTGDPVRVPYPAELDAAELGKGAKALDEPPCDAYREAWAAYRQACADHHALAALDLIADLLERFGAAYAEAKAARAGLDFEDLELGVRDLLASGEEIRRRWSERFALIMVDEFQDTNRLQLDVLEALERDNLFAVGDEFQSIYGFRHADVTIFRERRAALGEARVRRLTTNFRSSEGLLDVLNAAFAPLWEPAFAPLAAGRDGAVPGDHGDAVLRLFDPDSGTVATAQGPPPVELLVTDRRGWDEPATESTLGLGGLGAQPWRRAEARLVALRLREEIDAGRRPGDVVVLVRATASLRLFEQALEEQGLPTYVVGGRGYWSAEQVRDGLAYLSALANPLHEEALLGVLASPLCGVGADALVSLADAGRANGGVWSALRGEPAALDAVPGADRERLLAFAEFFAGERERAERDAVEVLLERAIAATGYDLAVLARAGGERRLANLRKLMRLAREYERAEGRDLRGFLAYAATQDLTAAREGEAPLESEGLDAVRLMTIHRAKGLEFPVVCVPDLGRQGVIRRDRLLVGRDGSIGLRLQTPGGGDSVAALETERLAAELAAEDDAEERRLFYVAMPRARERLILSGATDPERRPAPRPGGAPLDWIAPALLGGAALAADAPERTLQRSWDGRPARVRLRLSTPATLPAAALSPAPRPRAGAPGTALPAAPKLVPAPAARPRPGPERLSYSALQQYARCPYRFHLQRELRLPEERIPAPVASPPAAPVPPPLDPRLRGTLAHVLLEELDFAQPAPPDPEAVRALGLAHDTELTEAEVQDIRAIVAAFGASPLCGRLAAAPRVTREGAFAFALDPDGGGPLVNGFVDVLAHGPDGDALIVDYKSDRLDGADPAAVVAADYATQRLVYALAALHDGAPAVEVSYCFLERPAEPVSERFEAAEAPELAERLQVLAASLLAGERPVTDTPHRDLCIDCPGRRTLCSYDESMTLREYPAN